MLRSRLSPFLLCALLPALQAQQATPPAATATPEAAAEPRFAVRELRDLAYAEGDRAWRLDLFVPQPRDGAQPASAPPLLVWIHGGGWTRGSKSRVPASVRGLVDEGYALASVGYRLSGLRGHPEHTHDCKGAIRWLRAHAAEHGYDAARIGVAGGSAGGHLALMLGMTADVDELEGEIGGNLEHSSRVQAVADLFGPADFELFAASRPQRARQLGAEFSKAASPVTYASEDDAPVLILQGDADRTVPPEQSRRLHEVYRERQLDATLFVVAGAGHGGPWFGSDECKRMLLAFFDLHVREDAAAAARLREAIAAAGERRAREPR